MDILANFNHNQFYFDRISKNWIVYIQWDYMLFLSKKLEYIFVPSVMYRKNKYMLQLKKSIKTFFCPKVPT